MYSPEQWQIYVNPEGARYYVNATLGMVTDTAIHQAILFEGVMKAFHELKTMEACATTPASQNTEIFVQLQGDEAVACKKCNYYIVDHDKQTEFWYHSMDVSQFGICDATSESHVGLALQEQYWVHTEYYPHRPVSKYLRDELVGILRHGQLGAFWSFIVYNNVNKRVNYRYDDVRHVHFLLQCRPMREVHQALDEVW